MDDKKAQAMRLRQFRATTGRTAREMSRDIESKNVIAMAESGRQYLTGPALRILAEKYGLNIHWLVTGQGPMRIPPLYNNDVREQAAFYQAHYDLVDIPLLDRLIAGGLPAENSAERIIDTAWVIKPLVPHPGHTYGVHVAGRSMAPVIDDGYLALIDIHPEAIRPYEQLKGRPVAVKLSEGISIKWFSVGKNDWIIYAENKDSGFQDVRISRQVDPPVVGLVTWWCPSIK